MTGCVFCEIVAGRSPASVFYDDGMVLGIMDINPINNGHALMIPRRHVASLSELDEETGRRIWTVAQRATESLYAMARGASGLRCEGVNLFLADGAAAGQEVAHVHLHLFPRFHGDPFRLVINYGPRPDRQGLDRTATQLREAYEQLWGSHAV